MKARENIIGTKKLVTFIYPVVITTVTIQKKATHWVLKAPTVINLYFRSSFGCPYKNCFTTYLIIFRSYFLNLSSLARLKFSRQHSQFQFFFPLVEVRQVQSG